jgi:membrane protease YdiL (CAAX protease family)
MTFRSTLPPMSEPGAFSVAADSSARHSNQGVRRIVIWSFLVWFTSVFSAAIFAFLHKDFNGRSLGTLLVLDTMLAMGSGLLLRRNRISWKAAGICLPEGSISWAFNLSALVVVQLLGSSILFLLKAPDSYPSSLSIGQRLLWMCAAAPVTEEIFSRGWFQTAYFRAVGTGRTNSTVLASAAVFAGMHVFVSASLLRTSVTVIAAFLSGIVFARVRQASGSLVPAVLLHSCFNLSGWIAAKPLGLLLSRIRG